MTTHQALKTVLAMIDPATATDSQRRAIDFLVARLQEEEERIAARKIGQHHARDFFQ